MPTNVPKPLLMLATILSGTVLGACEPKRVEMIKPPAELTECAAEPTAPDLPGREQQAQRDLMTFGYILALRSAYGDCAADVAGIKAWSDGL